MNGPRLGALAAAAIFFGSATVAGCSDGASYKYITVTVAIDNATVPRDILATIASCEFDARGVETPQARNLDCPEGSTPYDLGVFQWTTTAETGLLTFVVRAYNANRDVVAQGMSDPVDLSTGDHLSTGVRLVRSGP